MAIRAPRVMFMKKIFKQTQSYVPKGHLAVYVGGTEKKSFLVPVSYLNQPLFQDLLRKAEEEFVFNHPMGGLTIPCNEEAFFDMISQ